ncbi:hypothetical protein [Nocardioides sp. Root151]|uniref:hypothetical protein n=1 Tax=Nocardioides sp. Root151 TaxID=1736475 RepID=UPI000703B364|nr:hypothetical protein [Nocardioides sp. Root151]KQZ67263.1 hypothetical protein ASD66_20060 [Nocardioides sp. Root151]
MRLAVSALTAAVLAVPLSALVATGPATADDSSLTNDSAQVETSVSGDPEPSDSPAESSSEVPADETETPSEPVAPAGPADDDAATPQPESTEGAKTTPGITASEAPSAAAAYADRILAPANGANVPAGNVSYTFVAGDAASYYVELTCDDTYDYVSHSSSYAGQQFSGSLGPANAGEDCRLEVYNYDTGMSTYSDFTVALPAPEVRNLSASRTTFYPRVRDGYLDKTGFTFGSRLDSAITVSIRRNATGRVVRTLKSSANSWADYYGRRTLAWNGLNAAGSKVPVGRYTAIVKSTLGGRSATAHVVVQVATGYKTFTISKVKDGWYDSRDQTRGNCYTRDYDPGNHLDCWGGAYAQASYNFAIPANARNIRWAVGGYSLCCDSGRLIRTGTRVSPTRFMVRVKVTYWRSFVVERVRLRYTARRQI